MKKFDLDNWYKEEIEKFEKKYGDVPPPWICFPDTHPYDIMWRMGNGESFIMIFGKWWSQKKISEYERIEYFKKYPSPPRWLGWKANAIWDLEPEDEDFDYEPYFKKLSELGFKGINKYEIDMDDKKWLE